MTVLAIILLSALILGFGGWGYSRLLGRWWGEAADRVTPAVSRNDGRDFVPTPTGVVFAHHFASIAGAGPIIGPVIALCYGWLPALIWILVGGLLVGAVHDYLATFMAVRAGGCSVATVARQLLGRGPFVALVLFLVLTLALVCATFLNLSAQALVSMLPFDRIGLTPEQTWFRVIDLAGVPHVVIGGIASTSVIVITILAPLVGWLYIRRQVAVWKCSLLALAICAVSISIGFRWPVVFTPTVWKWCLAGYVLVAAGLPVWMFLQSRDFINVHILYVGLTALVVTLMVASLRGGAAVAGIPVMDLESGRQAIGPWWPMLFITIACGAVSGFHSLCAGGTTCKQIQNESAIRRVGYGGMLLESFLAVCVVAVLLVGLDRAHYLADVHPALIPGAIGKSNPILGFAAAVGQAVHRAFGIPVAAGAVGGMILLEGFLVTTLDTAVRLMRYLLEEVWKALFGLPEDGCLRAGSEMSGSDGLPAGMVATVGGHLPAGSLPARILGHYWVNSALAVGLTLWFAFSGGILALWAIFATANQLLAAFVLGLGTLWLIRQGRRAWYVLVPAVFMLATTVASLVMLFTKFRLDANRTLLSATVVLMALTLYLVVSGVMVYGGEKKREDEGHEAKAV